jgi:DNA-directed RNA polymerase beta' subunit
MASNHVKGVAGSLYDILSYNIQMILRELYEYIKIKVSKKSGMIRNLMLGKRVDFSARAVVVPDPTVTLGELGVPLRIICQIFEPFMIYGIANSPYSKSIPQSFHDEVKKFLKNESILEIM